MALEVEWYDFVCFGIVGIALIGAFWVLWMNEAISRRQYDSMYASLLLARPDHEVVANLLPKAHVNASQLWTSCWPNVHPSILFATRFTSFLIMAILLAWDVVDYDASIFYYYTEWTWTLVIIYFALGSIVSAYGCWYRLRPIENVGTMGPIKLQSHSVEEEFQLRAGFWGYLMQITYQVSAGAVTLTDIVFWCVIAPFMTISHLSYLNPLMDCMHTLNAVFLLVDTALNNLPFPWFRIAYFVLWTCVYVIFQWIVHACGVSWWPYPFLVLNSKWAPVWYLCLALAHFPCYGLYALIVIAKNKILARLYPHASLTSTP